MGVDLRRGDVGMAKQRLQHAQVRPALQQMRGEGMAQHVRADLGGIDLRARGEILDQLEQANARQMLAARWEQVSAFRRSDLDPARQRVSGARGDGHHPLLRALAGDGEERRVARNRCEGKRHQFGGAKSGAVKQLQQRQKPQRDRTSALRLELRAREQRLNLPVRENLRKRAARRRAWQAGRRIVLAQSFVDQEPVELPQCRRPAGNGGGRKARPCPTKPRERLAIGVCKTADFSFGTFQVAAIGGEGIGGGTSLGREHRQEGVNCPGDCPNPAPPPRRRSSALRLRGRHG